MGTGISRLYSFRENEEPLVKAFKVSRRGLFGHTGWSKKVRQIVTSDPLATASEFARIAGRGGHITHHLKNGGYVVELADGTHVTFRPKSTSSGPAVDLHIEDSVHVVSQKIHFEKGA